LDRCPLSGRGGGIRAQNVASFIAACVIGGGIAEILLLQELVEPWRRVSVPYGFRNPDWFCFSNALLAGCWRECLALGAGRCSGFWIRVPEGQKRACGRTAEGIGRRAMPTVFERLVPAASHPRVPHADVRSLLAFLNDSCLLYTCAVLDG
jgi:hypothetical protein